MDALRPAIMRLAATAEAADPGQARRLVAGALTALLAVAARPSTVAEETRLMLAAAVAVASTAAVVVAVIPVVATAGVASR